MKRALLALVVLLVPLALPIVSAADVEGDGSEDGGGCDANALCRSLLNGLEYIGKKIVDGFEAIFGGIFGGFVDDVVRGFFGIFREIFGGIGEGGRKLFENTLGGAGDLMEGAYAAAIRQVSSWGILAPFASTIVNGIIVLLVIMFVALAMRVADNPLPGPIERLFKDEKNER